MVTTENNHKRFDSPTVLSPHTIVLNIPVEIWDAVFTADIEKTLGEVKQKATDLQLSSESK